ncbi:hypothetical protein CHH79_08730 [Bacillus siamensis]|nr:hypothetical protein CHH79_08730 [Bacillus siamensis]
MTGLARYIFRTQPFFSYITRFYLKFLITCSGGTFFAFGYFFSEKRKSLFSMKTGFSHGCVLTVLVNCFSSSSYS